MMLRRAIIAISGLLAMTGGLWPASAEDAAPAIRAGEYRVPFQMHDGLIYVQGRVNGMRATMLIDTGAALTTFTLRVVPTLDTDSRITINMAKGSVLASRLPVGFVLGDSALREGHCSFHQNAVVGAFKFLDADGLVGQDVLSHFKSVTFDFKNSTLILEDR
jgi:predicted aspartyl protease